MSSKALAACAILAAVAGSADAFSAVGALPSALRRPDARTCLVRMQAAESVSDILARAKAMEEGGAAPSHHNAAPSATTQHHNVQHEVVVHHEQGGDDKAIADIIARAKEISEAAASMRASFNQPSAKPASTRTVTRGTATLIRDFLKPDEGVSDMHGAMSTVSEAAEMISLGRKGLENGRGRRSPSPPPLHHAPTHAAPVVAHAAAPARNGAQGESVADILARAAAMEASGAQSKGAASGVETRTAKKLSSGDSIVGHLKGLGDSIVGAIKGGK